MLISTRHKIALARLAYGAALHITLIGMFFNQVPPSTVGSDATRARRLHMTGVAVAATLRGVSYWTAWLPWRLWPCWSR